MGSKFFMYMTWTITVTPKGSKWHHPHCTELGSLWPLAQVIQLPAAAILAGKPGQSCCGCTHFTHADHISIVSICQCHTWSCHGHILFKSVLKTTGKTVLVSWEPCPYEYYNKIPNISWYCQWEERAITQFPACCPIPLLLVRLRTVHQHHRALLCHREISLNWWKIPSLLPVSLMDTERHAQRRAS